MSNEIDDGGPAFMVLHDTGLFGIHVKGTGMSLRDYFAGQVISKSAELNSDRWLAAKDAYEIADAMIAARKPKPASLGTETAAGPK